MAKSGELSPFGVGLRYNQQKNPCIEEAKMPVILLLPLALILYFYLDRRVIRRLEARLKEKPELPLLLQLAAQKAALDLVRDVAWVSLIVFGAAVATTLLVGVIIRINAQNAREALSYLGPVAAKIREWKSYLWIGTGAFSVTTVLFARIRFRTLEKQMTDRLAKMYAVEIERLHEQQRRGQWEILPPTDDMQEMIDVLDRRGDRLSPDQRERVLATIVQMDYERRMQLDWDELWNPKTEMKARPSDLSGRVIHFLSGQTPLKAWKTGQRCVSLAATGCWLLAAIGIGANAGVLPAIQERFVTAWDVVVAHNGEASGEGDRNEERSTPTSTTPVRPGPQDTERINRLAREFERAATQSRSFWEQPHREAAYQQREVREFILRSAEHAQPESRQAAQATETAVAEAAPEGIRAQVNIAEAAVRETGPRTELGRMFRDHVLKQAARNPKRWARWQARMASGGEFLRYSGLNNAGEAILGEAWGQAMGAAGDLPYLAKELMKKVPKAVLEKAYQQKVAAMESALDGRFSFGEAFARVSEAAWRDPVMPWRSAEQMREWTASVPSEEAVIENLAKRPPYIRARPVAETSNAAAEAAAENLAGTLSKWSGSTRHRSVAETLVVYDDWLMPQGDRAPATLRTAFLKKSPAPLTAEEVSSSYSAARSFQALRGFSRVGGIMIGRDAPPRHGDPSRTCGGVRKGRGYGCCWCDATGPPFGHEPLIRK
jgi:hypothetical protein